MMKKIYNLQFTIYKKFPYFSFLKIAKLKIKNCSPDTNRTWLSVILFFATIIGMATPAFAVTISPAIPGITTAATTSTSPDVFVAGFYQFALMIGGILALGAIVWGGILYASSAGNPSKQSEGREWIKSALFGILLLAGAYLILFTINPNLVNLTLPTLTSVSVPSSDLNSGLNAVNPINGVTGVAGACTASSCTGGATCMNMTPGVSPTHTCYTVNLNNTTITIKAFK